MSDRFGLGALRLARLAAQLLGWRPAEFWEATPAELVSSLAPPLAATGQAMTRPELDRLMERDDGRCC